MRNTLQFTLDVSLFAFLSGEIRNTKKFVRIYKLFLTNKPNVKYMKFSLSSLITSKYVICGHLVIQKTNPIQTQYKPKQSQYWPIIGGSKAKQTQFKFLFDKDKPFIYIPMEYKLKHYHNLLSAKRRTNEQRHH